jgi:hypothetical protein
LLKCAAADNREDSRAEGRDREESRDRGDSQPLASRCGGRRRRRRNNAFAIISRTILSSHPTRCSRIGRRPIPSINQ